MTAQTIPQKLNPTYYYVETRKEKSPIRPM